MSKINIYNKLPLGKKTVYEDHYNPLLLQPIPRKTITKLDKLVYGEDIWNFYEISWLNPHGKPVVATAQARFSLNNKNIIESKSLKMYLNSFNQTVFNHVEEVRQKIVMDLQFICKGQVILEINSCSMQQISQLTATCIDDEEVQVNNYQYNSSYLENAVDNQMVTESLCSHLLKTNCPVTGQPDWGSIRIDYEGLKIKRKNLLKYLISFRKYCDFHEQCAEQIFIDLQKHCQPKKLLVMISYTRRGGIDINPWRSDYLKKITPYRLLRQ